MAQTDFRTTISKFNQYTAGIVYSFESSGDPREIWYDRWNTRVLSACGEGLQGLGVEPFYIDVNNFCRMALSSELPRLDFIVNLNAGIKPISNWALVPSVASWCSIPVIPCSADIIIAGERKDLSNLLAKSLGLKLPKSYTSEEIDGLPGDHDLIIKARDLGGSKGISTRKARDLRADQIDKDCILQDFLYGFDITLPIVRNPLDGELVALPAIAYIPHSPNPTRWFHSRVTKEEGKGYEKRVVYINEDWARRFVDFAENFGIKTYCRIDLRLSAKNDDFLTALECFDAYFMEINPMPTIRQGINFLNAVAAINSRHPLHESLSYVTQYVQDEKVAPVSWLLACSIHANFHSQA